MTSDESVPVGIGVVVMRATVGLWKRYVKWAERKRHPALWIEIPLLLAVWIAMFWIVWGIVS